MYPTTSLSFGMSGPEVTKLQKFLVSQGMSIPSGPTGYFGNETKAAVTQWQQKTGVQAGADFGYWGPKSISVAAKPSSSGGGSPVVPPSQQPTGPATMGKTPVILNNGITVYKDDRTGLYYDASGGQFSPEAINKAMTQTAGGSSISPSDTRSDTTTDTSGIKIPEGLGIDDGTANSGLNALTPEQLSILYPQLKPGTSEYQAAMDKISSAYFDVMQQQMNAQTEQEQQAAQYNWGQLKKYIETNLNVKLSDNALQAWDQIQGLGGQFNQQNIQGSGLQQEAMDNYLNRIRRADSLTRTASQSEGDIKQQDYYRKFATPEQIKALIASDPQKAAGWGLVPSGEMKQAMNPSLLKQKYPDMSDEQIQAYIATVLDENGNFRSTLYQKHMMGGNIGTNNPNISTTKDADGNPISVDVTPSDYGRVDIDRAREQNKQEQIQMQNLNTEWAKRKALGTNPKTENNYFDNPPKTDTAGTAAAGAAAANLGTATLQNPIPNPTTVTKPATTTTAIPAGTRTTGTGADTYVYNVPYTVNRQKSFYSGPKSGVPVSN